jgi:uncharacterized protein (DUF2267 family)
MRPRESNREPHLQPNSTEAGGGVLEEIERSEDLPGTTTAEEAFSAVMCGLRATLGNESAERLERDLPTSIRKFLSSCAVHEEGTPGRPGSSHEFLLQVGEHLEIDETEAQGLSRMVFHAVHRLMSVGEVEEVARELPADMRELWASGDDHGAPFQRSRLD